MKKAERLNGVVFALKERGRLTAKQLADIFEVSERTIYRDIDALSQLKVPLVAYEGLNGGYEIEDAYFIPSIELSEDEALILLMILKLGRDINFPNYKSDYELLRSKIVNTLNPSERQEAEKLLERVSFYVSNINPTHYVEGILKTIMDAIISKKQLEIVYYTPATDQSVQRKISIKELFFEEGAWYLAAFCHLRKAKRVFRLDRIVQIAVLKENNVHMDEVISSTSDKYVPCTYTLEITKSLYRVLKENYYFKEAQILSEHDWIKLEVTTTQEHAITHIVLGNPEEVTVLGPIAYLTKINTIVNQLRNKYKYEQF